MILEADDRPMRVKVPPQHSFADFGDYATTIDYTTIGEHELNVIKVKEIEEKIFSLQIMSTPGCLDQCYFAFLELSLDFKWKLKVDNSLAVCLKLKTDICEDDWSASVVTSLPFAKLNDVTMLLRRRYLKEEERYDDIVLPVTL